MYLGVVVMGAMEFKTQRAMLCGFLGERESISPLLDIAGTTFAIQCHPAPLRVTTCNRCTSVSRTTPAICEAE